MVEEKMVVETLDPSKKKFNEYDLTQNNFCRKLCDFKESCFKDCFGGTFRSQTDPRDEGNE